MSTAGPLTAPPVSLHSLTRHSFETYTSPSCRSRRYHFLGSSSHISTFVVLEILQQTLNLEGLSVYMDHWVSQIVTPSPCSMLHFRSLKVSHDPQLKLLAVLERFESTQMWASGGASVQSVVERSGCSLRVLYLVQPEFNAVRDCISDFPSLTEVTITRAILPVTEVLNNDGAYGSVDFCVLTEMLSARRTSAEGLPKLKSFQLSFHRGPCDYQIERALKKLNDLRADGSLPQSFILSLFNFMAEVGISLLAIKARASPTGIYHNHPMASLFVCAFLSLLLASVPLASATAGGSVVDARAATAQTALGFTASDWIWTSTTTSGAFVGFRKDFTPPVGKALIASEILITAADQLGLFVNGEYIGAGTPPDRGRFAQRYCVDLLPSFNVFAVNASINSATNGGMLATILLTYTDGSTDMLVSDSSWRVHSGLPAGYEQPSFDDTTWTTATVAGTYQNFVYGVASIPSNPAVLNFNHAEWIWTNVVPASGKLPAGSRAFRRTFTPAAGQLPMSANIIIAADNEYTLYINGVTIGSGTNFKTAQHYTVNFATPPSEVVLAALVTNTGTAASTAGLIFVMEVNMVPSGRANCTAGSFALSDALTKSVTGAIPAGFEQPGFDDSAWPATVAEETYAAGPNWSTITIAAASPPVTV
ncbi:hypothetical protein C8R44DRAFT_876595 [Mycena epipterygia]|nr:hypothetical protein C8R44DRAFT_876595 [Mycena epipterygia]